MKLLAFCLLLCSCAYTTTIPHKLKDKRLYFTPKPPEFDKFKEIYSKPYRIHEYDCSNKCAEYVYHLNSKGIFSQILSIDHDGPNRSKFIFVPEKGGYAIERHAIVRIFHRNRFMYCDPTNFTWSNEIRDFTPAGNLGIKNIYDLRDFSRESGFSF